MTAARESSPPGDGAEGGRFLQLCHGRGRSDGAHPIPLADVGKPGAREVDEKPDGTAAAGYEVRAARHQVRVALAAFQQPQRFGNTFRPVERFDLIEHEEPTSGLI